MILANSIFHQRLSAPLQTTSQVGKTTKNLFTDVMFDECGLELWPEMTTRWRQCPHQ